jgi:hypothetical protein
VKIDDARRQGESAQVSRAGRRLGASLDAMDAPIAEHHEGGLDALRQDHATTEE